MARSEKKGHARKAASLRAGNVSLRKKLTAMRRQMTERREAHMRLENAYDHYADLYDFAPVGYMTLDAHGVMRDLNLTAAGMLGHARTYLTGRPLLPLIGREDRSTFLQHMLRLRKGTRSASSELAIAPEPGGKRIIQLLSVAWPDGKGNIAWRTAMTDVTELRLAQEALRQANEELEQRVRDRTADLERRSEQLRAMASELTLAEQHERQRLARVLHDDLQQLLVGARMHLGALRSSLQTPAQREQLEYVTDLLGKSLQVSRDLTVELSPTVLYEGGLEAAIPWLARKVKEQCGLTVDVQLHAKVGMDRAGVAILVFQAVRELLLNVVKHSGRNSAQVRVERADAERVRVIVSDEGKGFDVMRMLPSGNQQTGLGLLSIRERITHIGGSCEVDSEPGKGTRVTLTAPLPEAPALPAGPPAVVPAAVAAAPGPGGKIRVLLVDDHSIIRQGLARIVAAEPDMEVVGEAADGDAAVESARRLHPDVVIMDFNLPGANGAVATERLARQAPGARVIGLSMYHEEERAEAMRQAGAVAYFSKDKATDDLLRAIRQAAGQDRARRADAGPARGATIAHGAKKVQRPGGAHKKRR